jgi:hypothetical protein
MNPVNYCLKVNAMFILPALQMIDYFRNDKLNYSVQIQESLAQQNKQNMAQEAEYRF